jgi:hypothetical protein
MALTKVKAGNIILTTPGASSNDVTPATTQYVTTAIGNLVDTAPSTLNTLNELAAALGDDVNFSTTVTNSIATKLPLAGGSLTGALDITSAGDQLTLSRSGFDNILFGTGTANSQVGFHITNSTDSVVPFSLHENAPAGTVVIDASGNVGIGTAANRKLEIAGNNNSGAKANYIRITDTDTSATLDNQQGGIEFYTNDNTPGIAASLEVVYAGSGGGGEFTFNTAAHSSAGVLEAMRIDSSGNVGIGTSSPSTMLHLSAGTTGSAGGSHAGITMTNKYDNPDNSWSIRPSIDSVSNTGLEIRDVTDNRSVMVFDGSGNVGIGTTNTNNRLTVSDATNISMSAGADGQLRIEGNGYSGAIALDGDAMHIYQNSTARDIVMGNNETEQFRIKANGYVGIGTAGTSGPLDLLHLNSSSGDVRQLMNAPTGSDAEIKFSEGGGVVYTIGHDAASSEFRIGTANVDTDVFLRAKSTGPISIGRGGEEDGLSGLQVLRGGVLINGGFNDMGTTNQHYANVWTWVGCSGLGGTFNGAVRVNVPNPTGGASGYGYGGFSMEVYIAGYNAKYCHAFLSGYTNNGITLSENAVRASSGGWSTSYGTITSQGFYFDINYPSGLIHPSIYIRVSKGGHTASGRGTDFNDINVTWS